MLTYRTSDNQETLPSDTAVYLHVGLPKTGTSLVQARLFPHHRQIEYLGKILPGNGFATRRIETLISEMLRKGVFNCDVDACRRLFEQVIQPLMGRGRAVLISMEDGSFGSPHRFRQKLNNLRAICGDVRIIFTLRNPRTFVESMYFQRLKRSNIGLRARYSAPRFPSIGEWLDACWERGEKAELSHLNFGSHIADSEAVFGAQNTFVIVFEQLRRDPQAFLDNFCAALGVDSVAAEDILRDGPQNPRLKQGQLARLREIQRSPLKSLAFRMAPPKRRRQLLGDHDGPAARAELPECWAARVDELTQPAIQALGTQRKLPLKKYGY